MPWRGLFLIRKRCHNKFFITIQMLGRFGFKLRRNSKKTVPVFLNTYRLLVFLLSGIKVEPWFWWKHLFSRKNRHNMYLRLLLVCPNGQLSRLPPAWPPPGQVPHAESPAERQGVWGRGKAGLTLDNWEKLVDTEHLRDVHQSGPVAFERLSPENFGQG